MNKYAQISHAAFLDELSSIEMSKDAGIGAVAKRILKSKSVISQRNTNAMTALQGEMRVAKGLPPRVPTPSTLTSSAGPRVAPAAPTSSQARPVASPAQPKPAASPAQPKPATATTATPAQPGAAKTPDAKGKKPDGKSDWDKYAPYAAAGAGGLALGGMMFGGGSQ